MNCEYCDEPLEPVAGFPAMVACKNGHALIGTDEPLIVTKKEN